MVLVGNKNGRRAVKRDNTQSHIGHDWSPNGHRSGPRHEIRAKSACQRWHTVVLSTLNLANREVARKT